MYVCACAHVCVVAGMEEYKRNTDGLREQALSSHTFHLPHWTISRVITPEVIQEKKTDVTRSFSGPPAQASCVGRGKAGTGSQGKMISNRPCFLLPEKTQRRPFLSFLTIPPAVCEHHTVLSLNAWCGAGGDGWEI